MVRDENGPNQGRDKHDNGLVRPKLLGPGRRTMFRAGMAAGMVALAGRARADDPSPPADGPWSRTIGPGVVDRVYGMPSHFEKDVIRRDVPFLTATPQSSVSFTPLQHQQGIITASGVFFERYHAGRPTVDPALHRLMIHGMVEQPRLYTMQDIERFPSVSRIHFIECPANGGMEWRAAQLNSLQFTHGMLGCAEWTGVKVSTILEEVGIKPEGKWALVEGADGAHMARSIPVSKLLDDCMLVYGQNGEALRPEQGYPLRLLVPGWQGNVNVKWIRRIQS
jgi:sulfane dehydrogenase subunit SoxC